MVRPATGHSANWCRSPGSHGIRKHPKMNNTRSSSLGSITPTECITFPRSGHHILLSCLADYFGPTLRWSSVHSPYSWDENPGLESHGPLGTDPATNFQKNHDFRLDTPIEAGRKYVIQYREPLEALISWYKMRIADGRGNDDSPEAWERFARDNTNYWRGFVRKWILSRERLAAGERILLLDYAWLVSDPSGSVDRVVRFLTNGSPPDSERIADIVQDRKIRLLNPAESFVHYDPGFAGRIRRSCRREWNRLPEIPPEDPRSQSR